LNTEYEYWIKNTIIGQGWILYYYCIIILFLKFYLLPHRSCKWRVQADSIFKYYSKRNRGARILYVTKAIARWQFWGRSIKCDKSTVFTCYYLLSTWWHFVAETVKRTVCYYIVFDGVETWKGSITAAGYDNCDLLASCGENCKRQEAHGHALPVKIKILLFQTQRKFDII